LYRGGAIAGVDEEQLKQNLVAIGWSLTAEQIAKLVSEKRYNLKKRTRKLSVCGFFAFVWCVGY
jgi:hypothetical protein